MLLSWEILLFVILLFWPILLSLLHSCLSFELCLPRTLLEKLQGGQLGVRKGIGAARSVRKQETRAGPGGFSAARLRPAENPILPSFAQVASPSLRVQALGSPQRLPVSLRGCWTKSLFWEPAKLFLAFESGASRNSLLALKKQYTWVS